MERSQEVNEINLIDLMFYCLKKWRWLVISMVLFGIAAGVYKYQAVITENQIKEESVSSAVSFAVIGMFGGACLVFLILCMRYVMSGKLQSESGFQERFGMPLLGVVRKKEKKKKIFGFIDRWICRLEEGPYAKITRKEQIKIAAVNVQAAIRRNPEKKMERVMLAGTAAVDDVTDICEELAENIEDVIFSPYGRIVFHAAALKKLEYYEGILFIEKRGQSYERLIRQEKELAAGRNIKVLGTILC